MAKQKSKEETQLDQIERKIDALSLGSRYSFEMTLAFVLFSAAIAFFGLGFVTNTIIFYILGFTMYIVGLVIFIYSLRKTK